MDIRRSTHRWGTPAAVALALGAVLATSLPAFADQGDHDNPGSKGSSIQILGVNETQQNGTWYVTVKLGNVPRSAKVIVFRNVADTSQLNQNDDAGHAIWQPPGSTVPDDGVDIGTYGTWGPNTLTLSWPISDASYYTTQTGNLVAEADKYQNADQQSDDNAPLEEVGQESDPVPLDPGNLPYGQLPEVPFAAALPLALGGGLLLAFRLRPRRA